VSKEKISYVATAQDLFKPPHSVRSIEDRSAGTVQRSCLEKSVSEGFSESWLASHMGGSVWERLAEAQQFGVHHTDTPYTKP
jgi:hypothetical protein